MQEAVVKPDGVVGLHPELPELTELLRDFSPIESTDACRSFELTWKHYVAYLVTEELAGSCGRYDDEVFTGSVFRVYTKSHFLGYLARDTGGHTAPLLHFKLVCLNHLVDVAAYGAPEFQQVGPIPSQRVQ